MRKISHIVVHCTATSQRATVESIQKYWKEQLKWKSPGYHFIVLPDGTIRQLLDVEKISNGVAGFNHSLINISYIGGIDGTGKPIDNRTAAQKASLLKKLKELKAIYPNAVICGHRDFPNVKKACPSFDASQEYLHV